VNFSKATCRSTQTLRGSNLDEKTKEIVERPWFCDITGNPFGTDTLALGVTCQCQGCRAARKITSLSERVGELERGVRALLPHLHLGHEGIVSDCLLRSRSEQLRLAAEREAKYEGAVLNLRALSNQGEGS